MKILTIALSSISILMVLSTLICGLWIQAQGATPESVGFHVKLASATVGLVLICLVGLIVLALRAQ